MPRLGICGYVVVLICPSSPENQHACLLLVSYEQEECPPRTLSMMLRATRNPRRAVLARGHPYNICSPRDQDAGAVRYGRN